MINLNTYSLKQFKKQNKKWSHVNHLDRIHEAVAPDYIDWLENKIEEYEIKYLSQICKEIGCSKNDKLCPGNRNCKILRSIVGES